MYSLTDNQKDLLRKIVQRVRAGNMSEEFFIMERMGDQIFPSSENHLYITELEKRLLENNGFIQCDKRIGKGLLTRKAYEAVDNNFSELDTSFVKELTPFADITNLDEELKKRCLPILRAGSTDPMMWDSAVRTAGVILENRLRDVGGITDDSCVSQALVNNVFNKNGTLASKFSVDAERQGYRDLYAGIIATFRNPSAHRLVDPTPEEGGAFIVFVNLLLKKLEDLR